MNYKLLSNIIFTLIIGVIIMPGDTEARTQKIKSIVDWSQPSNKNPDFFGFGVSSLGLARGPENQLTYYSGAAFGDANGLNNVYKIDKSGHVELFTQLPGAVTKLDIANFDLAISTVGSGRWDPQGKHLFISITHQVINGATLFTPDVAGPNQGLYKVDKNGVVIGKIFPTQDQMDFDGLEDPADFPGVDFNNPLLGRDYMPAQLQTGVVIKKDGTIYAGDCKKYRINQLTPVDAAGNQVDPSSPSFARYKWSLLRDDVGLSLPDPSSITYNTAGCCPPPYVEASSINEIVMTPDEKYLYFNSISDGRIVKVDINAGPANDVLIADIDSAVEGLDVDLEQETAVMTKVWTVVDPNLPQSVGTVPDVEVLAFDLRNFNGIPITAPEPTSGITDTRVQVILNNDVANDGLPEEIRFSDNGQHFYFTTLDFNCLLYSPSNTACDQGHVWNIKNTIDFSINDQ